jgi:predicted DsbA family dithiol-disulfide isomerase
LSSVENGQLSKTTRAHRLAAKAYIVGGQELQQALIQSYFKAFFEEGKDIGNLDLLGDLAQNVQLMSKDEVRVLNTGYSFKVLLTRLIFFRPSIS